MKKEGERIQALPSSCPLSLTVFRAQGLRDYFSSAHPGCGGGRDVSADSPSLRSVSPTEQEFLHTSRWHHSASHRWSGRPEVKRESVAPWTRGLAGLRPQGWMDDAGSRPRGLWVCERNTRPANRKWPVNWVWNDG